MLAVADEIFLLGLPFLIVTASQKSWIFGLPMCKIYMTTTSINQVNAMLLLLDCIQNSVPIDRVWSEKKGLKGYWVQDLWTFHNTLYGLF